MDFNVDLGCCLLSCCACRSDNEVMRESAVACSFPNVFKEANKFNDFHYFWKKMGMFFF